MKYLKLLSTLALSILFLTACGSKTNRHANEDQQNKETAYESMKQNVADSKEEFITEARKSLAKMDHQMEEIQDRIQSKSGEAKEDLQKQWKALKKQEVQMKEEIDKLQDKGEQNWENMKGDLNDQYQSMKASYKELKSKLGVGES